MKKYTTAYDIKLDHSDLTKRSQPRAGIQIKPLSSGARNQDCFRFEVMKGSGQDLQSGSDSFDYSTVTCNICNIKVPTKYIKEHKRSEKHKICMQITETALQRVKANMSKDTQTQSKLTEPITGYFCEPCAVLVTNEHHDTSEIHKSAILHDKLLEDLRMVYLNRDNIKNIKFKYLTNFKTKDIENDEVKDPSDYENDNTIHSMYWENKNIANNIELKLPSDCQSKNFESKDETKHQTDWEDKKLESNIEIKFPTAGNSKDFESVDVIKYSAEFEKKDTEIRSEEINLTACRNKDLENNVEDNTTVCQNKNLKNVNEIKFPTEFENEVTEIGNEEELTACKNEGLENDVQEKTTICQNKDLQSVDEIKYSTEFENQDAEVSNDEKSASECENEDNEYKVENKYTVCQNENFENVNENKCTTESENKNTEISNEGKSLTDCENKDLENVEKKTTVYQSKDLESVDAIKYSTEFENKDAEVTNDKKGATDYENVDFGNKVVNKTTVYENKDLESVKEIKCPTKLDNKVIEISNEDKNLNACENIDLENNAEKNTTVFQNKDFESEDKTKYSTEFENKGTEISNEEKRPTSCDNKNLDNKIEMQCPMIGQSKDFESVDETKHSLHCKNEGFDEAKKELKCNNVMKHKKEINQKQDIEDTTEQIIYKHTTVITDLSSMENYFKILMKIFSQTSLIYVYMNKMFVGINIDDFKLKVHVDSFLGINREINMCLLCSSKYADREEHIYNIEHMKKVMAPIEDQHCIRKINETSFYCVICAGVIVSKKITEYAEKTDNLAEKVAHISSERHEANLKKALLYETSQKKQDDLPTRTSKTFCDEHICNVCGLFVSNSVVKDRNTGSIKNSKYKEYFCNNCQTFMPLKNQLEHIENVISESNPRNSKIYDYVLHPKHAIKTYCGACDTYVYTHYLESHTYDKTHRKIIASNARLSKLAQTKAELKEKAVITGQSERNKTSIANEVLEDLLWAQMKISKNTKEVICKVCNVAVAKALNNVHSHIKGKTHQENFSILLFSSNIKKRAGLEQICARTDPSFKSEHVTCETCDISIPNTSKDIEAHVIGINHQNNISIRLYKMEEYKPYTVDTQVMSSDLNRYTKPVNVPSGTRHHTAAMSNKAQSIPIENLIKTNKNGKVKKLRPLNSKEAIRPDNVQTNTNQRNNLEKISLKPTWLMQSNTHVTGINLPKNINTNVNIKQLPLNFTQDIGSVDVQAGTSQVNINYSAGIALKTSRQRFENVDRGIDAIKYTKKIVDSRRYQLKKIGKNKYQCIVCRVDLPLSETHVTDHLLAMEHENNYRSLLHSNRIEERKEKPFCKLCNFEPKNRQCLLTHIEGFLHRNNMKTLPTNIRTYREF